MTDICHEIEAAKRSACAADPEGELCQLLTELWNDTCGSQSATSGSLDASRAKIAAYYDGERDKILAMIDRKAAELA